MVDKGFFRSQEFLVAATIVGVLLVGAVAFGAVAGDQLEIVKKDGCREPTVEGTSITVPADGARTVFEGSRTTRVVTYELDTQGRQGGVLRVCDEVGHVSVSPSTDGHARVIFTIVNRHDQSGEAVHATIVDARFTDQGERTGLAAWVVRNSASRTGLFGGEHTTSVSIDVEVPADGSWAIEVDNDVGDVTIAALQVSRLEVEVDVGDVDGRGLSMTGDVDVRVDVGDVDLSFSSVETSTIHVETDVGDQDIRFPSAPDIGYDVEAASDVGNVRVEIGEADTTRHEERGPSEHVEARSTNYTSRAIQVRVQALADVGSIDIIAT